jgi:hypothetical protein
MAEHRIIDVLIGTWADTLLAITFCANILCQNLLQSKDFANQT